MLALFAANWIATGKLPPAYSRERQVVLDDPNHASSYVPLAKSLWDAGEEEAAKRQLAMARSTRLPLFRYSTAPSQGSTLGVATSGDLTWQKDDQNDLQLYAVWKERLKGHEQWRDAYLMLAVLATRLGYKQEAHFYIEKAQQIDPYSDTVQRVKTQIEN